MSSLYLRRRQLLDESPPADAERYGSLAWILTDTPGIVIWYGKSKRPKRWRFRSIEQRAEWLASQKAADDSSRAHKQERKAARAADSAKMADQIQVGTILHYSWGYDQTNCDFYQVVAKSGRRVTIREIGSRTVDGSEGFMSDRRTPAHDKFIGPPMVKMIGAYGVPMDFGSASPCGDDSQHYCSWYA